MEKITSFTIDHIKLQPGIYVSRKDAVGGSVITTFDIRMTSPNEEPVMNTAELHTIEHLAATYLRNHEEFGSKMIYWGPMGCRTGNYLLLNGDYESKDILPLMIETFEFIRDFQGEVPGASKGLRKLSGHESSYGKISGKKISGGSPLRYKTGTACISGIKYSSYMCCIRTRNAVFRCGCIFYFLICKNNRFDISSRICALCANARIAKSPSSNLVIPPSAPSLDFKSSCAKSKNSSP